MCFLLKFLHHLSELCCYVSFHLWRTSSSHWAFGIILRSVEKSSLGKKGRSLNVSFLARKEHCSNRLTLFSLVLTFNLPFDPEARAHVVDACGCCHSSWEGWVLAATFVGPSRHRLLPRAGTSAMESGPTCTSFMRTVPPRSGSMRMISRSRDHLTGGAQYSGR